MSVSQYYWEEMLGVGILAAGVGLHRLAVQNRRLLGGLACWILPTVTVSALFRLEGQHDYWLWVAWLPLYLTGALGLCAIGRAARRFGALAVAGLGGAGVAWAVLVNAPLLKQRGYDLAELYGKVLLGTPERGSILIVTSDDSASVGQYLQKVRGAYPDLLLVRASRLGEGQGGHPGWYEARLLKLDSTLRIPHYGVSGRAVAGLPKVARASAAFINANAGGSRPIFIEEPPPERLIRTDHVLVPAGALWKVLPRKEAKVDPRHWIFPIEPEQVRSRFGRERSPRTLRRGSEEVTVFEPFERRLFTALLRARVNLADVHFRQGRMEAARALLESVARAEPETLDLPEVLYPLAVSLHAAGDYVRSEPLLRRALSLELSPEARAMVHVQLAESYRKAGRAEEASEQLNRALLVPGLDEPTRRGIRDRLEPRR